MIIFRSLSNFFLSRARIISFFFIDTTFDVLMLLIHSLIEFLMTLCNLFLLSSNSFIEITKEFINTFISFFLLRNESRRIKRLNSFCIHSYIYRGSSFLLRSFRSIFNRRKFFLRSCSGINNLLKRSSFRILLGVATS